MSGLLLGPTVLGARLALDPGKVPQALDSARAKTQALKGAFTELGAQTVATGQRLRGLATAAAGLVGIGGGVGLVEAVRQAGSFEDQMTRVQTMLGPGEDAMRRYGTAVKRMALDFGQSAEVVSDGLYQALSAGVSGGRVEDFLGVAGKMAVGGFTDMKTSVDGLTNVMNAYNLTVGDAKRVANDFTVATVVGKTTVAELAAQIGQVGSIAKTTGVSVEELFSAVATGSTVGLSTSTVVTGLRAALAALAGPSKEAQELAAELGLQFNEDAIKGRGFGAFLQDLAEKTGGSAERMETLFGSVEAVGPLLKLTSREGLDAFNKSLSMMGDGIDRVDANFQKRTQGFQHRAAQFQQAMAGILRGVGEAVLEAVMPATAGADKAFAGLEDRAKAAAKRVVGLIKETADEIVGILKAVLVMQGGQMLGQFAQRLTAAAGAAGVGAGVAAAAAGTGGGRTTAEAIARARGGTFIPGMTPAPPVTAADRLAAAQHNAQYSAQRAAGGVGQFLGKAANVVGGLAVASIVIDSARIAYAVIEEALYKHDLKEVMQKTMADTDFFSSIMKGVNETGGHIASPAQLNGLRVGGFNSSWSGALRGQTDMFGNAAAALAAGDLSAFNMKAMAQQAGIDPASETQMRAFERALRESLGPAMAKAVAASTKDTYRYEMGEVGKLQVKDGSYVDASELFQQVAAQLPQLLAEAGQEGLKMAEEQGNAAMTWYAAWSEQIVKDWGDQIAAFEHGVAAFEGAAEYYAAMQQEGIRLEMLHVIKDPKKPARTHSISLQKRGVPGQAKHLNPRYRLYVLSQGAAGAIVRPMEEDYVNAATLNGGGL